ncbi:hypothetical protein BGZ54_007082 [Gamsiella multidivaricata]|nr:hypothetical protein BGZ54_007082 [Gamsiella multidivaricata]
MLVILETFILPDSPYELNLSDSIRSRLLKAVTVGDYNPQVLGDARNAVTDLMKSSSYPLFLESVSGRVSLSTSSSSSASMLSQDDSDRDHAPWRLRAKENLKLVSKALKMHGL